MSYRTERKLISDYNYGLAAEYWLAWGARNGAGTATSAVSVEDETPPEQFAASGVSGAGADQGAVAGVSGQAASAEASSIAFSGVVDADGVWRLSQA